MTAKASTSSTRRRCFSIRSGVWVYYKCQIFQVGCMYCDRDGTFVADLKDPNGKVAKKAVPVFSLKLMGARL